MHLPMGRDTTLQCRGLWLTADSELSFLLTWTHHVLLRFPNCLIQILVHHVTCWPPTRVPPSHPHAVSHPGTRLVSQVTMRRIQQSWRSSSGPSCPRQHQPTLTEMWPWAWGRWAAKNQSPGKGLLTLKMPDVRLGSVQLRVSEKTPGTAVSPGKCVCRGLMTGGAPDRKYLGTRMRKGGKQAMRWEMRNGEKKGEQSLITSK